MSFIINPMPPPKQVPGPPPPRRSLPPDIYAKISKLSPEELERRSIKENYTTLSKYLGPPNWDSRPMFQFGVGCNEEGVYKHYMWLIDNIFMSAAVEYLQAQFARGYTPKPLFDTK